MKKLSNISGAKKLSRKEQKSINGGAVRLGGGPGIGCLNGCPAPLQCCNGKYCIEPDKCEAE